MSQTSLVRRCVFVKDRECLVDVDEVPLEVCRLCIEAWKTQVNMIMVRRSVVKALEALPLIELDRMFESGEIELEEYISRRGKILESLRQRTSGRGF